MGRAREEVVCGEGICVAERVSEVEGEMGAKWSDVQSVFVVCCGADMLSFVTAMNFSTAS